MGPINPHPMAAVSPEGVEAPEVTGADDVLAQGEAPPSLTMAKTLARMEAALQGLHYLQAGRAMLGDLSSLQVAWERDLWACEEELLCREEQVQLALVDAAKKEKSMVAQEQCLEEELGSIPSREQDLATRSKELEERRTLFQ